MSTVLTTPIDAVGDDVGSIVDDDEVVFCFSSERKYSVRNWMIHLVFSQHFPTDVHLERRV